MATGLGTLGDEGVDAGADQLVGDDRGRQEGHDLGAAVLDPLDHGHRRQPAGQHDVGHLLGMAGVDQPVQLGMHDDQVDAEGLGRQSPGRPDLFRQPVGLHRPQARTPKPPPSEMAATNLRSETQVIAPPMMA